MAGQQQPESARRAGHHRDFAADIGVASFATHHLPLEQAPHGYEIFRNKDDGCIKVVLQP